MPGALPGRSSGTVPVTIGLVTINLALYSSIEDSAVKRSQFIAVDDQLHPVGMKTYDKVTGDDVAREDIIKCIESSTGTIVPVSDEELQQFLAENGTSEFVGFVDRQTYEQIYTPERKYQVRPAKVKVGGKSAKGESPFAKPFAVILDGMRAKNVVGIVKFVSRGTTRYYSLLPDGSFYSLYFDEEIRSDLPLPVVEVSDAERKMGEKLVEKFTVKNAPVLVDVTNEKVAEFVENKATAMANGEEVALPVAQEPEVDTSNDLMSMFEASLS